MGWQLHVNGGSDSDVPLPPHVTNMALGWYMEGIKRNVDGFSGASNVEDSDERGIICARRPDTPTVLTKHLTY